MANSVGTTFTSLRESNVDMRDAFFDQLYSIISRDRDVILLTDDQGAFGVQRIQEDYRDQYINVGIAEQNLVSVAAGLALGGKKPFIYGIATFMSLRCYEQIKVDLCALNLPVTIIGSGAGYTYSYDGPTHHAVQDVAVMRTLPEMSIYNPSDAVITSRIADIAYHSPGPKYVRIEKGQLPAIYSHTDTFASGFHVLRPGRDVMIVSTGVMVHKCLRVADALANRSVHAGVLDLYRVKPVDHEALLSALKDSGLLVTVEEHSIVGGVGSLVGEILLDGGLLVPLKRAGLPDRHAYDYGDRDWLHALNGLDEPGLAHRILQWLNIESPKVPPAKNTR